MSGEHIVRAFKELQNYICEQLKVLDNTGAFEEDEWLREEGGGGRTRILRQGSIIEKGGVNFSEVYGKVSDEMRANTEIRADEFLATGVSVVLHPFSPHIPIIHMNVRYFELSDGTYWFGGGIDLTPHFITETGARVFHEGLKSLCDEFDSGFYIKFKDWADNYFFLPHRNETRGVGGIFFDHLRANDKIAKDELLNFCIQLGQLFPELYKEQVELGIDKSVSEADLLWQSIRRGRYVEFNLVHDKGTKFGLVSGGRTESILMSLPPMAKWDYQFNLHDIPGADETTSLLRKGIDWI